MHSVAFFLFQRDEILRKYKILCTTSLSISCKAKGCINFDQHLQKLKYIINVICLKYSSFEYSVEYLVRNPEFIVPRDKTNLKQKIKPEQEVGIQKLLYKTGEGSCAQEG